ncbi:hypothetical protein GC163_17960 [bacterium]|nr:hypothetical protein [bacterium]
MTPPLLKWTGHPLADVGVATLCAMADKDDPSELTLEDLTKCGKQLKTAYTDGLFIAYLTCVFPNSPYINANPKYTSASREIDMARLLQPHSSQPDEGVEGISCIFSGEPATHFLNRSNVPMLTGAGVLNFFPAGLSEMPVAAPYVLAIQALALGGRRSEGKLLIVHCDDPQWTLHFARKYVARNRFIINLATSNRLPTDDDPDNLLQRESPGGLNKEKKPKYPDAKAPKSLVMDDLMEVITERNMGRLAESFTSVTVYLLSNSGQGPSLAIEQIPGEFVSFLQDLHGTKFSAKWKRLVARAWRGAAVETETEEETGGKRKPKKPPKAMPSGPGRSHNDLYNDLLDIFDHGFCNWQAATRFIRRHLLARAKCYRSMARAASSDGISNDKYELIDWTLTELFLTEVLGMDKARVEMIKDLATRLANLIYDHNDKGAYKQLVFTGKEFEYRSHLTRLQRKYAEKSKDIPFTFDEYVNVFLLAPPEERVNWNLIRDLISIRLVEVLHERNFLTEDDDEPEQDVTDERTEESVDA